MSLHHASAIIIKDQKVLLIKRSTGEDSEPNKWYPVNETLEENEKPEEAVIRGVREETGIHFTITKQLPNHYFEDHTTFIFIDNTEGKIKLNPEEVAEFGWFFYNEAMKLKFAFGYKQVIRNLFDLKLIA